jgi:hypothetical protein
MIGREKEKIINRDDKGVGWVGPLVQWYPIFFFWDKEKYGKMRESKSSTWQGGGILPYLEVVLTNESKKV